MALHAILTVELACKHIFTTMLSCLLLFPCRSTRCSISYTALSRSGKISPDFCCFYGGGIRHNEDIMHSFQNFIVRLIPNHPPPLETRIWKLVVRAVQLQGIQCLKVCCKIIVDHYVVMICF